MAQEEPLFEISLLERLDVAIAGRLAGRISGIKFGPAEELPSSLKLHDALDVPRFVTGLLALRGLSVHLEDVTALLSGRSGKLQRGQQEHALVVGLNRVLVEIRGRVQAGRPPDGWWLVECFRTLTREIPRFRNNDLRRDVPWDALLYVSYPEPTQVRGLVDTFDPVHRYRDLPVLFDRLHPVRRAVRILWRAARIAPFPDFNVPMAVLAMNASLAVEGYPMWTPVGADRDWLSRILAGPPPQRVVQIERGLLDAVGTSATIG